MISARKVILIITLAAFAVFGFTAYKVFFYAPDTEIPLGKVNETREYPSEDLPVRLVIPTLQIDTDIQHVGVTAKGNMANPDNFTDVGWYKYGTAPGYIGSAVVAGHVDNALALDGVFKRLHELKEGDDIYIETKGGETLRFRVRRSASYAYDNAPTETIFNTKDVSRLNLITCTGSWLKEFRTYDKRLVVYTELIGRN